MNEITIKEKGNYLDVTIGEITIYGCQRKTGTKDGKPYDFIAMPQRKGKDEKWYAVCSVSRTLGGKILEAVKGYEPEGIEQPPFDGGDDEPPF